MTMTDSTALSYSRRPPVGATLSSEHTISGSTIAETRFGGLRLDAGTDWVHDVSMEIKELLLLSEGWDGGVAMSISGAAASIARQLAEQASAVVPRLLRPAVTPTVDGRVVLTWHRHDAHIEVTLSASGAEVFYEVEESGEEWEGELEDSPRNPADLLSQYFS